MQTNTHYLTSSEEDKQPIIYPPDAGGGARAERGIPEEPAPTGGGAPRLADEMPTGGGQPICPDEIPAGGGSEICPQEPIEDEFWPTEKDGGEGEPEE